MTNELQIFENKEFGKIEVLTLDGKEYFPATDCAKILGYSNAKDAILRHCRWVVKHDLPHPQSPGKTIEVNFIPEGDLYRLIARSKLPSAEKFERWVFDEVIPQIRATGGYIPINESDTNEEFLARAFIVATETIKKKDELIALKQKQLEEQKPLVYFANKVSNTSDLIDMNTMAKLLKDEHINVGGRNGLFKWLRGKNILMGNNDPYQKYINSKYFEVKEVVKETAYGTKTFTKTLVTGKGQIFITEKLRKEFGDKPC